MSSSSRNPPCPVCGAATAPDHTFGQGLRRCSECTFAFLPAEAADAAELYTGDYFADYRGGDYLDMEPARRRESRLRLQLMRAAAPPPARLLEVGAAAGFFLAEAAGLGYSGVGIETNPQMARHAREELGLDVRTEMIEDADLGPEPFDVACAWHVVEHLPDPVSVIRRLADVLRVGGHLYMEVPNADSATARRQGPDWLGLDLPHHVGHFGPRSMTALLERTGFEPVQIDSVPFLHYYEPRRPVQPFRWLAAARESLRAGRPLGPGPHPGAHQLLRVVARRA